MEQKVQFILTRSGMRGGAYFHGDSSSLYRVSGFRCSAPQISLVEIQRPSRATATK